MKKLLVIAALALVSTVSSWAQGTLVFANGAPGVNAPVDYEGALVGSGYVADLYWGAQGTAESSLTAAGFNVGFSPDGYFLGGSRALPTTGTVTVQVRVWNTAAGATYEEASASPSGIIGESNLIDVTLATGSTPTPNMVGLQAFSVQAVPEPSTFALGALGIGALLMVRRRKA